MYEYVGLIDFIILGTLLGGLAGLLVKIFNLPEFMGIILFLAIGGFIFYTDDGRVIRSKIAIFNQKDSWTKSAKNNLAMQCIIFSNLQNKSIENYTDKEKALIRCCIKRITYRYSQDSFLSNENSMIFKIRDSIDACKK